MEEELHRAILTDVCILKAYEAINKIMLNAVPIGMTPTGFIYDEKVNKLVDNFHWYIEERIKNIKEAYDGCRYKSNY